MEIKYWIKPHEHPLRLEINDQFSCQVCNSIVEGAPFYVCDSCTGFRVHASCAGVPYQIQHPFHPHSALKFLPTRSTWCYCCFQNVEDAQFYSCGTCSFNMDAGCALMPLATSGSEGWDWIQVSSHQHPLLRDDDQHNKCIACKSKSHQDDLYGCSKCEYFLHKSCDYESPPQVHLPIHRNHHDGICRYLVQPFVCKMCNIHIEDRYSLAYRCRECSLYVCYKCSQVAWTSSGSFKYEDHEHLLCLVEDTKQTASLSLCDGYDFYCKQHAVTSSDEFKRTESSILWCYQCGFRVHFLCSSLPSAIKHEFHIHTLVLVDSMREDDSGEYYCDVCETRRDPLIRLYCCRECKYFAHVHCLIPEILKLLGGDLKNVALKRVNQDLWNVPNSELQIEKVDSTFTLKDVINQLSKEEKKSILNYYKWDESWKQEDGAFKVGDEEIDEILQLSHFTRETFRSFWSNLEDFYSKKKGKVALKSSDLALKVVKVKGYMIPYSLAPVLNKLLHGYGDIDISFMNRSLTFQSFVLFIACQTINTMHTTMPTCITKNHLQEWYYHIMFAERFNFKVAFARKQLKVLVHAFFGFQTERLEEEIPTMLTKRITELKRKLDECNRSRGSSPESKYMKYFSNKASEFKWKLNAFEGSFNQNLNEGEDED